MSEAVKCKDRVKQYLGTNILDCGVDDDKIVPWAIGVDLYRNDTKGIVNLVGDATRLYWFQDNVFDTVFSSHTLEDIIDTESVLREWLRVLKPAGYLILYVPHKNYYPNIGHPLANGGHRHDFIPSDIINIMQQINQTKLISSNSYGPPNGIYDYDNRHKIEYSFEQVFQKL